MTQFEYVIVLMSFFVAFGASEILSGLGRQYLYRAEAKPYPLQIVASLLLLVALLQSVWGYWGFREASWGFGGFLLVLLPLLPLIGAAYLVMPPGGQATAPVDPEAHYLSVYRAIFALLAAWVVLGTVAELAMVEPTLHPGQGVRLAAVVLLLGLGSTSNAKLHWIGFGFLVALQIAFVRTVTPVLD